MPILSSLAFARRIARTVILFLLGLLALAHAPLHAAYPERPIQIVVPFAPGGGSDLAARALARVMASVTGYTFVVDNKAGAGGNIAAASVARAAPDGYTLLLVSAGTHGINSFLYAKPGFDPVKDFAPIGQIGGSATILFARSDFPASNIAELIALAKRESGKYSYGTPGVGTQHHLGMEMLKLKAGVDIRHIPFRGAGPGISDLVAGHLPLMMAGFGPAAAFIAQGKLKPLGAFNTKRLSSAKDVPLFSETVPGVGLDAWLGLSAPAGTPAEVVELLSNALRKALQDAEFDKAMAKLGIDVDYLSAAEFRRMIIAEQPQWKAAVEASGAKAE